MRKRLIELIVDIENHILQTHQYTTNTFRIESVADHLLENGVIVPPCKIGDTVYDISEFFDGTHSPELYHYNVDDIRVEKIKGEVVLFIADIKYPSEDWGKELFFTKEETEAALRERKEDEGK